MICAGKSLLKTFRGFRAKNIQHFIYLFIVARNFPYHFTPRGNDIVAATALLFSKSDFPV